MATGSAGEARIVEAACPVGGGREHMLDAAASISARALGDPPSAQNPPRTSSTGALGRTGADTLPPIIFAALLLMSGTLLIGIDRRRRRVR